MHHFDALVALDHAVTFTVRHLRALRWSGGQSACQMADLTAAPSSGSKSLVPVNPGQCRRGRITGISRVRSASLVPTRTMKPQGLAAAWQQHRQADDVPRRCLVLGHR
jgi:hypothetical protein